MYNESAYNPMSPTNYGYNQNNTPSSPIRATIGGASPLPTPGGVPIGAPGPAGPSGYSPSSPAFPKPGYSANYSGAKSPAY